MQRVGDHHIRFGHRQQHPIGGDLAPALAPLGTQEGVALGLFLLVLQVLMGHPHPSQVVRALPDQVEEGERRHDHKDAGDDQAELTVQQQPRLVRLDPDILGEPFPLAPDHQREDHDKRRQLDRALGEFDQAPGPVFVSRVLDRRQARQFRQDARGHEDDAALRAQQGEDQHRRRGEEREDG